MKARIFMYLFFFALLYVIFQYVNSKRYYKAKTAQISALQQEIDSLESMVDNENTSSYKDYQFSLKSNVKAQSYFADMGLRADSIAEVIKSKIIGKNRNKAGNPLIPYPGIEGPMQVNRVKVLNNRWIIIQFTDGTYWGEAIISYYLDQDKQLQFDTMDGVLYAE